jgi:porin
LSVGELAWTPTLNGLPGTYRVGLWRNTADFNDVYRDLDGQPLGLTGNAPDQHDSASGFYALVDQRVYQDPDNSARSLNLFANFIQSDRDVSYVENVWHAGAFISGPFAARPQDEIGLALGRLQVNEKSARRIRQSSGYTVAAPRTEYPMELYYGVSVTPALTLRPNVQYVVNPGGLSGDTSVVVFGLKTEVSF